MGTDIHYRIEKKNIDDEWELVDIDSIDYEIERNYPLFALLANVRNDYCIVPFESEYMSTQPYEYGNGDNVIYLNDMLKYNWDRRFVHVVVMTEEYYLNWEDRFGFTRVSDDCIILSEEAYWKIRHSIDTVDTDNPDFLPSKLGVRRVQIVRYVDHFKRFINEIIGFMKTLDDDPTNVRFVCSFWH